MMRLTEMGENYWRTSLELWHDEERAMPRENRRRERRERSANRTNPFPAGLEGGRYKPLSEADVYRIHEAALRVLEQTGVEILESECRTIFEQAGARVDRSRNRVFIPRGVVEAQLKGGY